MKRSGPIYVLPKPSVEGATQITLTPLELLDCAKPGANAWARLIARIYEVDRA